MRPGLARGLLFGVPVACALWAAILVPLILSPARWAILTLEASVMVGALVGWLATHPRA